MRRCYVWFDHPKLGVRVEPGTHGQHESRFAHLFGNNRMRWLSEYPKLLSGYAWMSDRSRAITLSVAFSDNTGRETSFMIPEHVRAAVARSLGGRISRRMSPYSG